MGKEVSGERLFIHNYLCHDCVKSYDWSHITYCSIILLQVMGIVRCPLYTLPNGLGFPAFLRHKFIGNSREQLLMTLERHGLLSAEEVQCALETSRTVNNYVTREEIKY